MNSGVDTTDTIRKQKLSRLWTLMLRILFRATINEARAQVWSESEIDRCHGTGVSNLYVHAEEHPKKKELTRYYFISQILYCIYTVRLINFEKTLRISHSIS